MKPTTVPLKDLQCGRAGFAGTYAELSHTPSSPRTLGAGDRDMYEYGCLMYDLCAPEGWAMAAEVDGKCVGMFLLCGVDKIREARFDALSGDNPCRYHLALLKYLQERIVTRFTAVHKEPCKIAHGAFGGVLKEWEGKLFPQIYTEAALSCLRGGVRFSWGLSTSPATIYWVFFKVLGIQANAEDKQKRVAELAKLDVGELEGLAAAGEDLGPEHCRFFYDLSTFELEGKRLFKPATAWVGMFPFIPGSHLGAPPVCRSPVIKKLRELECGRSGFARAYVRMQLSNPGSAFSSLNVTEQQLEEYGKVVYDMCSGDDRSLAAEVGGQCVGVFTLCKSEVLGAVDCGVLGGNPCRHHLGMCKELQGIVLEKFFKGRGERCEVLHAVFGGVLPEWVGKDVFTEVQVRANAACEASGAKYSWGFTSNPAVLNKYVMQRKGMMANSMHIDGDPQMFVKLLLELPIQKLRALLDSRATTLGGSGTVTSYMREIYDITTYTHQGQRPFKSAQPRVLWAGIYTTSRATTVQSNL